MNIPGGGAPRRDDRAYTRIETSGPEQYRSRQKILRITGKFGILCYLFIECNQILPLIKRGHNLK
jgi:hypothetical protein